MVQSIDLCDYGGQKIKILDEFRDYINMVQSDQQIEKLKVPQSATSGLGEDEQCRHFLPEAEVQARSQISIHQYPDPTTQRYPTP
jgi:hypothetical protein